MGRGTDSQTSLLFKGFPRFCRVAASPTSVGFRLARLVPAALASNLPHPALTRRARVHPRTGSRFSVKIDRVRSVSDGLIRRRETAAQILEITVFVVVFCSGVSKQAVFKTM